MPVVTRKTALEKNKPAINDDLEYSDGMEIDEELATLRAARGRKKEKAVAAQQQDFEDRLIAPQAKDQEQRFDRALRPRSLEEYIGQKPVKEQMHIFLTAARQRGEPLDHTLIFGPPGLPRSGQRPAPCWNDRATWQLS